MDVPRRQGRRQPDATWCACSPARGSWTGSAARRSPTSPRTARPSSSRRSIGMRRIEHGNVWYFGEATKAYGPRRAGRHSGSWLRRRARSAPGIVMTAHPAVGDAHRQEYWAGHAEDQYWLVDLSSQVRVPFGMFTRRRPDARVVATRARRDRREDVRARHRRRPGAGGRGHAGGRTARALRASALIRLTSHAPIWRSRTPIGACNGRRYERPHAAAVFGHGV